MNETWGIPGPTFLWLFIGACAAVVIGTFLLRNRLLAGPPSTRLDDLPPAHIAYLAGGVPRAVFASLMWLRKSNAIDIDERTGWSSRAGGIPAGASTLDSAVLHAAGQSLRAWQISKERSVLAALDGIRDDLERRGLILSSAQRRSIRLGGWLLLGLFAIGLVRLVAGIQNDKPIGYLILVLLVLLPLTLWALLSRPVTTRAAQRGVRELKRTHQPLQRAYQTAWHTNSPATTALAVGLFGTTILWAADPALAAWEMPARHAGTSSASGGGASCSSGGSDGGGGGGGGGGCGG